MATDPKVIEKIKKLLALSTSSNEHEAAAAAAKAQALLLEHQLTMDIVHESLTADKRVSGVTETERTILREQGKPGNWKVSLFEAVATTSGCLPFTSDYVGWHGEGRMVGRAEDVEMAGYVFAFLVTEIERLQNEYGKARWDELKAWAQARGETTHYAEQVFSARGNHPLRSKQSWVKGAVPEVIANLRRAQYEREQSSDATMALIVHKKAQIADFMAQKRGFADAADEKAQREVAVAKYRAEQAAVVEEPVKAESPSARRRREEAEERKWARYEQAQYRKQARERANTDWSAYQAGQETGRTIRVAPAVSRGTKEDKPLID